MEELRLFDRGQGQANRPRAAPPPRPGNAQAITGATPDFELIVREPRESFRWNVHGYPHELAKWHYHPEYELHLIQRSSGKMFVGDFIGSFQPGTLVLTGPNLPHNWVSDIARGDRVKDRDMLIQFADPLLRNAMRLCPELGEIAPLLDDARHGVEFHGEAAKIGARILRRIGQVSGVRRILLFFELLHELGRAPGRRILSSRDYAASLDPAAAETINKAIDYLIAHLADDVRLSEVARHCGMSDSAFSRFFKKNTGHGFVRYVNRMRVNRACMLLTHSDKSVTEICFDAGFNNLSNFNRQFRALCGLTPSEYRRQTGRNLRKSTELYEAWPAGAADAVL